MNLHKQTYNYKHQEKTMDDVSLEVISKKLDDIATMKIYPLVKDNGRIIVAFETLTHYLAYKKELASENKFGDIWIQYGAEKTFILPEVQSVDNIIVAEFWTKEKFNLEIDKNIEASINFQFNPSNENQKENVMNVYNEKELL